MRWLGSVSDACWAQTGAPEHLSRSSALLFEADVKGRGPRRGGCGNGDRARCGHVRTLGLTARALPVDRTPLLTGRAERKSWTSGILSQGDVSLPITPCLTRAFAYVRVRAACIMGLHAGLVCCACTYLPCCMQRWSICALKRAVHCPHITRTCTQN